MVRLNKPKLTTLRDVAREAGVSPATASLVLSRAEGAARIPPATQARVLEAAESLNYRPHYIARALRLQESLQIGLVVPNISHPYMPALIRGVGDVVRGQGYNLLLLDMTTATTEEVARDLAILRRGGIDGLVIMSMSTEFARSLNELPAVYIDEYSVTPVVRFDAEQAAYDLTRLFASCGLRRIAFVGSAVHRETFLMRERGYRRALRDAGVEYDAQLAVEVSVDLAGGAQAAEWLVSLDRLPSAAVVCTDVIALGLLPALSARGVHVPDDLAVASIDDVEMAALATPPLTCVHVPAYEIGCRAARILLRLIGGEDLRETVEIVPTRLIIRASSEQPGKGCCP